MRIRFPLALGVLLLTGACGRGEERAASGTATSQILDGASPEAREALGVRVDYRLTDQSFAQWEAAQRNLDRLPRSAFPASPGVGNNVIDRAVSRLESSPKARTAIEASGLTVRDFVLQTIALAQATEAVEGAPAQGAALVPQENFRFVDRHRVRIGRAQAAARMARRNAQREEELAIDRQLEADTALQTQTVETSSGDTSRVPRSGLTGEGQRITSDSAIADVDPRRQDVPPPPDTTRDSVLFD